MPQFGQLPASIISYIGLKAVLGLFRSYLHLEQAFGQLFVCILKVVILLDTEDISVVDDAFLGPFLILIILDPLFLLLHKLHDLPGQGIDQFLRLKLEAIGQFSVGVGVDCFIFDVGGQ